LWQGLGEVFGDEDEVGEREADRQIGGVGVDCVGREFGAEEGANAGSEEEAE